MHCCPRDPWDVLTDTIDEIVNSLVSEVVLIARPEQQQQQQVEASTPAVTTADAAKRQSSTGVEAVLNGLGAAYVSETAGDSNFRVQGLLSARSSTRPGEYQSSGRNGQESPATSSFLNSAASEDPAIGTVSGQQATELCSPRQQALNFHLSGGLIGKTDLPESVVKSKLLALKQRRLESHSSSLDLSRESSFDSSLQRVAANETVSSLQNSFAAAAAGASSGSNVQDELEVNEQGSFSLAPLPLDSNTGVQSNSCT